MIVLNRRQLVILSFAVFNDSNLFTAGMIACLLGLRHACDADHIAAIDNVTRRLAFLQQDSLLVGFFFAAGHSTIVCVMCIVVAVSASSASSWLKSTGDVASLIGTCVSMSFLLLIGIANSVVWFKLYRQWRTHRQLSPVVDSLVVNGESHSAMDASLLLSDSVAEKDALHASDAVEDGAAQQLASEEDLSGGCFTRCCPALLKIVDKQYKMYIVGFVFGLGFDTATEIALLSISVLTSAQRGSPAFSLIFAILFTSAMMLIDTLDGMLIRFAFDRVDAQRRLWFSLSVTAIACLMAFAAAFVQCMSLLASVFPDNHSAYLEFWRNLDSTYIGITFIGIFVALFVAVLILDCTRNKR